MRRWSIGLVLVGVVLLGAAQGQTPIKNPSAVAFACPDHATDTTHEIAIVRESDGVTIQTLAAGDPPLTGAEVVVPVNVQPVAWGLYRFRARAGAVGPEGPVWSDWSDPTVVWERAPGKPTGAVAR